MFIRNENSNTPGGGNSINNSVEKQRSDNHLYSTPGYNGNNDNGLSPLMNKG